MDNGRLVIPTERTDAGLWISDQAIEDVAESLGMSVTDYQNEMGRIGLAVLDPWRRELAG